MSEDVVIVGAARTPVGSFNGAFAAIPAHELGAVGDQGRPRRAPASKPADVDEVVFGQVLTAGVRARTPPARPR